MKLLKIHKKIEVEKTFGNLHLKTFQYSEPLPEGYERYTILHCWYEPKCEDCPMGWEDISYEGECSDCGCLLSRESNSSPMWKCMLPKSIKRGVDKWKNRNAWKY